MYRNIVCTFSISFIYALVRYNLFGPVELQHIPVYIVNKAVSVNAVILLFLSSICCYRGKTSETQFYGRISYHSALIHILLSLAIFSEEYYPNFFDGLKLSFIGESVILSGVLGLYCYWLIRKKSMIPRTRLTIKTFTAVFIVIHVFAMGFEGWISIHKWHGYLPPISLISFIFALGCIGLVLLSLKNTKQ